MLKNAVVCLLIAATAAVAWQGLDPVPATAAVEDGAHITWGAGYVWGLFPTTSAGETYAGYYSPGSTDWTIVDQEVATEVLENTSITFQWLEDSVLFVVGVEDGTPTLYWYNLHNDEWGDDEIPFNLHSGTCIAYQPNVNYNSQMNPVPGWIYLLPGQGTGFYRYAIPTSLPNVALDGIYPGQSAVIADLTPLFQWGNTAAAQYRLLVSTNSLFGDTVLDKIVSNPEYQDSSVLANGTYYWRSATPNGLAWSWSSTHSFEINGGWASLTSIPHTVNTGGAMAYDGNAFGHQSILALVGGGHREFYEYDIVGGTWYQKVDADTDEYAGTSITTHDATEGPGLFPWAAFGGSTTSDNPYYYDPSVPDWFEWNNHSPDPYYHSHFPQWLGPGASMAYGANCNMYLIVGEDDQGYPRNNFYWVDPPSGLMDGGQSGARSTGIVQTQVVARFDAVEVEYQLPTSAHVRATLHDALGRQVGVLDAGEQQAGMHRLSWDRDGAGRKLSGGAYFVLLDMGAEQASLKAVVR